MSSSSDSNSFWRLEQMAKPSEENTSEEDTDNDTSESEEDESQSIITPLTKRQRRRQLTKIRGNGNTVVVQQTAKEEVAFASSSDSDVSINSDDNNSNDELWPKSDEEITQLDEDMNDTEDQMSPTQEQDLDAEVYAPVPKHETILNHVCSNNSRASKLYEAAKLFNECMNNGTEVSIHIFKNTIGIKIFQNGTNMQQSFSIQDLQMKEINLNKLKI